MALGRRVFAAPGGLPPLAAGLDAREGYVEAILAAGGRPRMGSKASPHDDAKAESLFVSLKKEEVHLEERGSIQEAEAGMTRHVAPALRPRKPSPREFEDTLKEAAGKETP